MVSRSRCRWVTKRCFSRKFGEWDEFFGLDRLPIHVLSSARNLYFFTRIWLFLSSADYLTSDWFDIYRFCPWGNLENQPFLRFSFFGFYFQNLIWALLCFYWWWVRFWGKGKLLQCHESAVYLSWRNWDFRANANWHDQCVAIEIVSFLRTHLRPPCQESEFCELVALCGSIF